MLVIILSSSSLCCVRVSDDSARWKAQYPSDNRARYIARYPRVVIARGVTLVSGAHKTNNDAVTNEGRQKSVSF
jgi:hypothetical protein